MVRIWFSVIGLSALVLSATSAGAASHLEGSWSGKGSIKPKSGVAEPVTCRASFHQLSKTVHSVKATCASESVKVSQTGELTQVDEHRFIGQFFSAELKISGSVRVRVVGQAIEVFLETASGSGQVTMSRK